MQNTFSKIAVFQYSSEAQIYKGRLEAEGIQVFLSDEFTIDTDPLVSNAIGGVKLKVYKEDEERAKEILASLSNYSFDDEGNEIHCPSCNGNKIEYFTNVRDLKSLAAFLLSILFVNALPIYTKYEYYCEDCKTKFNLPKEN